MNQEEKQTVKQTTNMDWMFRLAAVVLFVVVIIVTIYRYSLIGKAINKDQYITALALSSPEVGTGISSIMNSLF